MADNRVESEPIRNAKDFEKAMEIIKPLASLIPFPKKIIIEEVDG